MTSQINHYEILEISQSATPQEIKQAYRRLAKKFHPDSQCETANHEKIISLNAAYEILSDPRRRNLYDRQLSWGDFACDRRQQRTADAQDRYQRRRQEERNEEAYLHQWLEEIYTPILRLISRILNSLDDEIDRLAADPFDDRLMEDFQEYLQDCRYHHDRARQVFGSQPNPAKLAKVAAHLYYCLDRVSDGIDELEWFTQNYDDRYLHNGKELFRIARRLRREAREFVSAFV